MDDAHGAIGIALIHDAGDVDLARSCSLSISARHTTNARKPGGLGRKKKGRAEGGGGQY